MRSVFLLARNTYIPPRVLPSVVPLVVCIFPFLYVVHSRFTPVSFYLQWYATVLSVRRIMSYHTCYWYVCSLGSRPDGAPRVFFLFCSLRSEKSRLIRAFLRILVRGWSVLVLLCLLPLLQRAAQRVYDGDAQGRPAGGATGDLPAPLHATYQRLPEHQGNPFHTSLASLASI